MGSNTSLVARQYRLNQWAEQIRACQSRPQGMTVVEWCEENNITPANYYYRMKEVRKACLRELPAETIVQNVVAVPASAVENPRPDDLNDHGLEISCGRYRIHVTESTSPQLLQMVLQVTADAE